jgi:hypothetical protein
MAYLVENRCDQSIDYEVTCDPAADWITLSGDTSGTLPPLETAEVTVVINSNAETLAEGAHVATVYFANTTDHLGDTTRRVVLAVGTPTIQYEWPLDSDPGWTTEAEWAFGQPTGQGGEHGGPDPAHGYTGDNVYGYNLGGDYPNYLPEEHLTSTSIDCTGLFNVHLKFWRWLGVEQPTYDHAYVRVSNDGVSWITVWQNGSEITDYSWIPMDLDISAVADDQPTVYLRWTMGPTDGGWRYCGWNIDDVEIWAVAQPAGDVDGDGDVDLTDLAALLSAYGACAGDPNYNPAADFDNSGCVNLDDLAMLLANYGSGT